MQLKYFRVFSLNEDRRKVFKNIIRSLKAIEVFSINLQFIVFSIYLYEYKIDF